MNNVQLKADQPTNNPNEQKWIYHANCIHNALTGFITASLPQAVHLSAQYLLQLKSWNYVQCFIRITCHLVSLTLWCVAPWSKGNFMLFYQCNVKLSYCQSVHNSTTSTVILVYRDCKLLSMWDVLINKRMFVITWKVLKWQVYILDRIYYMATS